MFSRPITEITLADLEKIIADEVPESDSVEFKETLPSKRGNDPWIEGKGSVGEYARNEALAEVVAFANAHGGTLIIGVRETAEKPSRAEDIKPLPKCADLAERLRLMARDCIEPQIQMLNSAGVVATEDGAGIVVIHVPRSLAAPHRLKPTKECYIRRADRTEVMTMYEIQNLTLQIERGVALVEKKFESRQVNFRQVFDSFLAPQSLAFAVRATAIPLSPLFLEQVHNVPFVRPILRKFSAKMGKGKEEIELPVYSSNSRPVLRGTTNEYGDRDFLIKTEIYCDGGVEVSLYNGATIGEGLHLFPSWFMGVVCNCMDMLHNFRIAAGAPEAEYGLEVEIIRRGEKPISTPGYRGVPYRPLGHLSRDAYLFPRYPIGPLDGFSKIAGLVERDFWNATGNDWPERIEVDFSKN